MSFYELSLSCFLGETSKAVPNGQVIALITSYRAVVEVALETITRLEQGRIPDPSVGETACQLRAVIYTEILNADHFDQTLETAKRALEIAQINLRNAVLPAKKESISLDTFLEKNAAKAPVDERVHLLVLGRILEKTRESKLRFGTDTILGGLQPLETIEDKRDGLGLGRGATETLTKYARKTLAHHSVSIVQQLANGIPEASKSQRLYALVSGTNVKTTKLGLETVPCFSSAEVWLDTVCRNRTPFILRVWQVNADTADVEGKEPFFFKSDGNRYEDCTEDGVKDKPAAFLVDAASIASPVLSRNELDAELKQREIRETFLAFLATHPAYGGDCKDEPGPADEDVYRVPYAENARVWECSPQNPRICRLFHIYAVSTEHWRKVV